MFRVREEDVKQSSRRVGEWESEKVQYGPEMELGSKLHQKVRRVSMVVVFSSHVQPYRWE